MSLEPLKSVPTSSTTAQDAGQGLQWDRTPEIDEPNPRLIEGVLPEVSLGIGDRDGFVAVLGLGLEISDWSYAKTFKPFDKPFPLRFAPKCEVSKTINRDDQSAGCGGLVQMGLFPNLLGALQLVPKLHLENGRLYPSIDLGAGARVLVLKGATNIYVGAGYRLGIPIGAPNSALEHIGLLKMDIQLPDLF